MWIKKFVLCGAALPGGLRRAVKRARGDKGGANLLQGLDIDESLGLEQVDEQIRDYLSHKGVRVIELFRQWEDDGTGRIEKKEFRRGMKELDPDVRTDGIDPEYARSVFEDLDVEMASAQASEPR